MTRRFAVVATVIGALLIGGAVTGTTLALWRDETTVSAGGLNAGNLTIEVHNASLTTVTADLGSIELVVGGPAVVVPARFVNTSAVGARNLKLDYSFIGGTVASDGSTAAGDASTGNLKLNIAAKGPGDCVPATTGLTDLGTPIATSINTVPVGYESFDACISIAAVSGAGTDGVLTLNFEAVQHS